MTKRMIRVGVSACLVGQRVRYDGGECPSKFLQAGLSKHVSWVPVCPEVGAGLGVPRETIRLIGSAHSNRAVATRSGNDYTDRLVGYSERAVAALADQQLCGFVLKSRSPTCGLERVRVYAKGIPSKVGTGIFARILRDRFPLLPIEEEGRLQDPVLRASFLDAVFAYARWRQLQAEGITPARLVAFHSDSKYQLMAHSPQHLKLLGPIVARCGRTRLDETARQYGASFMAGMGCKATKARHVNVLQHMAGYLRRAASPGARKQVGDAITDYHQGLNPRSVPVALLQHHVREHDLGYLARQTYFHPFPRKLALR